MHEYQSLPKRVNESRGIGSNLLDAKTQEAGAQAAVKGESGLLRIGSVMYCTALYCAVL